MSANLGAAVKFGIFAVVTLLLTGMLAAVVANESGGETTSYTARFTDASGIGVDDDVRIRGVQVGKVTGLEVGPRMTALVEFEVDAQRSLGEETSAAVKFRNIAGQRYLALDSTVRDERRALPPEATIPPERTRPALNLTELFNGFRPLLQALSPQEVNKLSFEIIQVFQGEGSTVESLLAHTASVTQTVSKKDKVLGQVIDNLNHVMGSVRERKPQLDHLVVTLQKTVSGLSAQREQIGEAITGMDRLTRSTAGLLEEARPPLRADIGELNELAGTLDGQLPEMEENLSTLPHRLGSLTRTASYGSWFNYYTCQIKVSAGPSDDKLELPLVPLPGDDMPRRCER